MANAIAAALEANGGFIRKEDRAGYKVNVTEPLRGTYRGLSVAAAGPPAGGLTLLQMLNFLEGFDLGAHGWPSTEAARLIVEAMAWAMADRELHIADPRFVEIPTGALADKDYAARARQLVAAAAGAHNRSDTTHVCVVADTGNPPSLTHTLRAASTIAPPPLRLCSNPYIHSF